MQELDEHYIHFHAAFVGMLDAIYPDPARPTGLQFAEQPFLDQNEAEAGEASLLPDHGGE